MTAAAIYCRISRDPGHDQLGVTRQRDDCEGLVARKGWTVGGVYIDDDCSAFSRRPRPEYLRMLDDLKNGLLDAVVAWHPDRLHRSPRELEDFIDLIEATKARVATCTAGDYDLSTPDGRLMARIVGSVARKESEDKSRRLRRKHDELAVNGAISGGGNRPFGFERDRMTIRPHEAEWLRDAARRVLAGDTLYRIVGDWMDQGVETATGARWSTTSLKSTLVRARIAGLREHHGEVVGKATWPAILDEHTWRQVRAILISDSRKRNPVVRSYLLSGLLRCQLCRSPMKATPRAGASPGQSVRAYGCIVRSGGCGHVYGLAEPMEELVTEAVLSALDGPALRTWQQDPPGDDDLEVISADEARLSELADLWADGEISRPEWLRSRERIEARLSEARGQIRRRPVNVLAGMHNVRESWEGLTLQRKRAILRAVLDEVTLGPASGVRNRFNPERIKLVWRA